MQTMRHFLRLAAPFWFRRGQWREWLLLAAVVGCALAIVHVSVWITAWNKRFYDALADFNGALMPALIGEFALYIALITGFVALGNWLRKILIFRWRAHLTLAFETHWLAGHRHYRLALAGEPDNPDQRIAEDIWLLSEKSVDLFKYFIMNAAKLGAFVLVLWQLSGVQRFVLGGYTLTVHGYLVWIALLYSLLCTLLMHWIGHKLQFLNVERQHREADYRATLLRVRDHGEQIAFYHGEAAEQQRLQQRFARIRRNWRDLIGRELRVEGFSAAYLRVSMFIPIIATLPMYLARSMTFGDMMQARSAFTNVQDGFGWFMDYYKRIIEWAAVIQRLAQFQDALDSVDAASASEMRVSNGQNAAEALLELDGLEVHTQTGRTLLSGVSWRASAGEWLALEGRSGIGKSTLLRVLAGLWPYYRGGYRVNHAAQLFLPQRPYLPQECLRAVAAYPAPACDDDTRVRAALACVGLARLADDLDSVQEWQRVLSGGEQQRLSLARALLNRPAVLFLDEATNQLDDDAAVALMQMLKQQLPDTLLLAVSHQAGVKALFERQIELERFAPANLGDNGDNRAWNGVLKPIE